jgi:hypothetical protein
MRYSFFLVFVLGLSVPRGFCQERKLQFNGFGHVEGILEDNDGKNAFFSVGEHDFFFNSTLSDRISFLGEFVVRFNKQSGTAFLPSIERSLIRYNYHGNHNMIFGKIHSPVNYWNDSYHHGRLFFPTIERPLAFTYIIPLHTLGLQLQGQNLGKLNFGYDIVVGNGINSLDAGNRGVHLSFTGAMHIKPFENFRIGTSYFFESTQAHLPGPHSGHATNYSHYDGPEYEGPMDVNNISLSVSYFGNKWELLNEAGLNLTSTDSLGQANNFTNFTYIGYRVNDKCIPYIAGDVIRVALNDLYVHHFDLLKFIVGFRYEVHYLLSLKAQVEHIRSLHSHEDHYHDSPRLALRIQCAYGF